MAFQGCKKPGSTGDASTEIGRQVVDVLKHYKMVVYSHYLSKMDEFPVDTVSSTEMLRLHYMPRFENHRTYSIARDSGMYVPFGSTGMVRYTGWRFRLHTKVRDIYTSRPTNFSTNIRKIDEDVENFQSSWDGLIALIDSTGVFKMRDSRLDSYFGNLNLFILEMKVDGTYKEFYFEPNPPLEPHIFIPIHEAFQRLCPTPIPLD